MANAVAMYTQLKRRYKQKEEEVLCLKEQIHELESNRSNRSNVNQAAVTRLELSLEEAKNDCVRLREENNALRNDMQRLKENQQASEIHLQQAKEDFDCCVSHFEVERHGFNSQIKQIGEELRLSQEKARELQAEASDQRTRYNHLKLASEQTERELATTQDLLHQTEAQLTSALDRVQEISDEAQSLEWQLKEARQERSSIKANLARLDQEKDALLLKVDEKTEQMVRVEAELESRDRRIASLEGFIADLQKKLDVALDTAARSEQSSRQLTQDAERLRKELNKVDHFREIAIKENRRLQNDLAAMTNDHQQLSRCLELSKREVEDLKLQLQGYVAELRRISDILEQKEAERMAMLEQYRTLSAESAHLESNNHSLESEARSTKTCLREAHTRIQDLEATLGEKKALVQGYEKQIKELTHQVAKMERKLELKSRAESSNKDFSRELEDQKHCLENKVDHLSCVNKQLEEEVDGLRDEVNHLKEQLGKERKNSATLEDVLTTTRQETLLRVRDNSELKGQVQCLQGKLRELRSKMDHGSEALRRCQTECEDYQTQVEELKQELNKERCKRDHLEENRRSRPKCDVLKPTVSRSRSIDSLLSQPLASSQTCTCCFLEKISSLRDAPDERHYNITHNLEKNNTKMLGNVFSRLSSKDCFYNSLKNFRKGLNDQNYFIPKVDSEATNSSKSMVNNNFRENSQECMVPERLISESKLSIPSDLSLTGIHQNENITLLEVNKPVFSTKSVRDSNGSLIEKIESMLKEQLKFIKEYNLPINYEGGRFELATDKFVDPFTSNICQENKTNKSYVTSRDIVQKGTVSNPIYDFGYSYASGDQGFIKSKENIINLCFQTGKTLSENKYVVNKDNVSERNYFNEEPVSPKTYKLLPPISTDNNLNRVCHKESTFSEKLIFLAGNKFPCSSTSIGSSNYNASEKTSSVYITAAEGPIDGSADLN